MYYTYADAPALAGPESASNMGTRTPYILHVFEIREDFTFDFLLHVVQNSCRTALRGRNLSLSLSFTGGASLNYS